MAYTIAVAGKGGTGKTAIASLIVAQLIDDENTPVLAIDADPNSNFNERLGVELVQTLGDLQAEVLSVRADARGGMDKHRYVEYQLQQSLVEDKGFDLLAMGRTEGPGCYCSVNNILRDFVDKLTPNYKYVVMDNEAGMEHLSRRTTRNVDMLLMVSDATLVGVRAAGRIYEMERKLEINVAESYLVVNRANGELHELVAAEIEKTGLKLLGTVPQDDNIAEYSIDSRSFLLLPDDSPARVAVRKLLDKMEI